MKRVLTGIVFLSAAVWGSTSLAYIPPASFLLDQMAKKRAKIGVRRLKVTLQCRRGSGPTHEEVLYLKVSGLVRRERGGGAVEICKKGQCWLKQGDEKPVRLPKWAYLPYLYIADGNANGERYMGLLKSLGVDTGVNTITRFFSRLAVVLGAKNWERDRPQFWLDKDLYLPLRLMVKEDKALVDILWIDWGTRTGGDWFPARLEIRSDGKIIEQCSTTEVKTGISMPEEMFKI